MSLKALLFPMLSDQPNIHSFCMLHYMSLMVHWQGDWPAVRTRYGHGSACSAVMERFMPDLLKTCFWCCFWPQDSHWFRIPKNQGISPNEKWEHSWMFSNSFQTDSGKKKSLFYNGRPPWCAFKSLRHLFLSPAAAVGMTEVASSQWWNLTSSNKKQSN